MRNSKINFVVSFAILVVVAVACSFSTANISSVKIGKDKTVSTEASTFGPNDTVYAVGTVANAPGAVKVKGLLAVEDVAGQKPGPISGLEKTLDLPGSGTATYTFTPPPDGWPAGKYRIEITLMDDSGAQKDQKTVTFTVS
ncbi:MAG TPA: hypothetical protein VE863_06960 [Pyrinomonadaceae bacterium]|jgi:hypothetical protein|nr:hypothetical protein [Pyrinomonadaceae bacterium]